MKCKNCKYWALEKYCRRHSPKVIRVETPESKKRTHWQEDAHLVTRWPETLPSEGCGEFKEQG